MYVYVSIYDDGNDGECAQGRLAVIFVLKCYLDLCLNEMLNYVCISVVAG